MTMEFTIRRAVRTDAHELAKLNKQLIEDEASRNRMSIAELSDRMLGWIDDDWIVLIAEDSTGASLAYMVCRIRSDEYEADRNEVYLRQFLVARDRRAQGLGTAIVRQVLAEWLPRGCTVVVESLATNPRGQRFWQQVGFAPYMTTYKQST